MRRSILRVGLAALLLAGTASITPSASADDPYEDPWLVNWPGATPAAPATYDASIDTPASTEGTSPVRTRGSVDCVAGEIACVDNVVDEMTERWLARACDHNGTFALTYLITTAQYRHSALTPGFYSDHEFLNHYDAVFGDFYFQAYDDWTSGNVDDVPEAWRLAFQAAEDRSLTGYGDMVMGMNAHIIRDLPYVIERIGLVAPDGTSRHADHSKVNQFLNAAGKIVVPRVAAIYDPTIDSGDEDSWEGEGALTMQVIIEWREEAWRKAEMLHTARQAGPEAYAAAQQVIETEAAALAEAYLEQYAATPAEAAARDAHCAGAWGSVDVAATLTPYGA